MRKHLLSFFLLVISLVCRAHDGENFVASDLFASLQPGDKAALLMVHFGTTHDLSLIHIYHIHIRFLL